VTTDPIPDSVKRLIAKRIETVSELEAILLLRDRRDRAWTLAEIGERLYVSTTAAAHLLEKLADNGFLKTREGRYLYAADADVDEAVAGLAIAYSHHVVAITNLIHANSASRVRELADACASRKEK
jgi:hypothetical protein